MENISLSQIIDVVRNAAGFMVPAGFKVEEKDGLANIVTSSDLAVQNFLVEKLSALIPGCGFICEEEGLQQYDREYTWVIDPIDGTANYARGIDSCCISVALKKDDDVVMGVVYSPWRGEMYSAEKGCGAFLNGEPIHTSDRSLANSIMCCALAVYTKQFSQACSDVVMELYPQINDVRRFGSAAMELCFTAAGKSELYFEIRLQPWDYSAGILILEEAGGKASNLDGVHPRFTGPDLVCGANNAANHAFLLEVIRKHIPVRPYEE